MLIHFDHPEGCHLFYNINVSSEDKGDDSGSNVINLL